MAFEFILTERFDGVAVITLNRPDKLNALSFPLVRELDEALTAYEADDGIKAVILTGAGERAFSAGADIHEMAGLSAEELATRQEVRGHARPAGSPVPPNSAPPSRGYRRRPKMRVPRLRSGSPL